MEYNEAAAERLVAVYLGPDVLAQRNDTLGRIAVQKGELVLDIGIGLGFLAAAIADQTGSNGKVVGIDISQQMIDRAKRRNQREWLSYQCADATALQFDDSYLMLSSAHKAPNMSRILRRFHRKYWCCPTEVFGPYG
ncbi:MAG: methyltransferase domain-containing protein [Paracoccaceae bacterium]|nr:methyltransferase domain-containing protein [Paracoccaceae bacterium]